MDLSIVFFTTIICSFTLIFVINAIDCWLFATKDKNEPNLKLQFLKIIRTAFSGACSVLLTIVGICIIVGIVSLISNYLM